MPPTLTSAEKSLLTKAINAVRDKQNSGLRVGKYLQARSGQDSELLFVGLSNTQINSGRTAGAKIDVVEYDGPYGKGWDFVVILTRAGKTWRYCHSEGPELSRAHDWKEITDGS